MVFAQECQLRVGVNLYLEEDQKDVKLYQHSMVKLVSLKKSDHFKKVLGHKKIHTDFYSLFAAKNFMKQAKNNLSVSFVMKKKIGNAVKRNRIKRKLKAIIMKMSKIKGAIKMNYTYIIIGKDKAYKAEHKKLFDEMCKTFEKV